MWWSTKEKSRQIVRWKNLGSNACGYEHYESVKEKAANHRLFYQTYFFVVFFVEDFFAAGFFPSGMLRERQALH